MLNLLRSSGSWVGITEDTVSAAAVAAVWIDLHRDAHWRGRAWVCLAWGLTAWVIGDLVWDGYTVAGVARPDVSFADVFYLAGYPLLAYGLYRMARARSGRELRGGLLDGLIFGGAAAVAVWQLLVVPTAAGSHTALTAGVWSAYPLGDVLLIAAAAWLALSPGRRGVPTYLLLTALVGTFLLDVVYSYVPTVSSFDLTRLDWLYPVTYLLIAASALHPESGELTANSPASNRMHPARLGLLGVSVCTVPAVAVLTDTTAASTRFVLLGLSILFGAAVTARFALAVRARESAQTALSYQATHDELTGAVNRVLLIDRIGHALTRAHEGDPIAVMYLDLDRFKPINDSLGHEVGDRLLVAVAGRIGAALRPSDTLGRFGGDEFVVVCEDTTAEDAVKIAERITRAVAAPIELSMLSLRVTVSIGIAVNGSQPVAVDTLVRNADDAMYAAKRRGGSRVELFDDALQEQFRQRRDIERALKDAAVRGELFLDYQPIVRPHDSSVAGFEALLRWRRPDGTVIAPNDFIPIAEETGLIMPIGDWVIRQVCEQLADWDRDGVDIPWISLNVSPLQLRNDELFRSIARALKATGAGSHRLVIELTESGLVNADDDGTSQLERIRQLGARVAIDDFGTGYSGLAYLRKLPVDMLKIDQAFTAELVTDPAASAVLAAIVHLAHLLRFEIIAEGAESRAQVELLQALECDYVQGFFYAAPEPPSTATAIARRGIVDIVGSAAG